MQKWYGDPVFLPGAEGALGWTARARLPRGSGQGGSRRHPPTSGEGSGGFHQLQEGKSSKTAASSVPEPPGRPRHLTEKGARVPGKIKIDLGLFSHWPRAGSGITGMNMVPPAPAPAARRLGTGCLWSCAPHPISSPAVGYMGHAAGGPRKAAPASQKPCHHAPLACHHSSDAGLSSACTQPSSSAGAQPPHAPWQPAERRDTPGRRALGSCLGVTTGLVGAG